MRLNGLQADLQALYGIEVAPQVEDYLVTDLAHFGLPNGLAMAGRDEQLLVAESDDALDLALYLRADLVERLEAGEPLDLNSTCLLVEGVSHFLYLVSRAERDRAVTLFELELQAEIDKYLSLVGLARDRRERRELFQRLFESVRFRSDLEPAERVRYQDANHYAARFCHRIGSGACRHQLRHFYRLPKEAKVAHINGLPPG